MFWSLKRIQFDLNCFKLLIKFEKLVWVHLHVKVIGRGDVIGISDVTGVVRGESELEDGRRLVDVSIDGVVDGSEPKNNDKF